MAQKTDKRMNRRRLLVGIGAQASLASISTLGFAQRTGRAPMDNSKRGSRVEPLFLSEADARQIIHDYCVRDVDFPLSAKQVDFLVSQLRPQLWLVHRKDGGGGLGETRLGGAPDLPQGVMWPVRPIPADAIQKAEQWKGYHDRVVKQMQYALPFEFIGQIDLIETARIPTHTQGLPTGGRLLFFWDGTLGLLEAGSAACHVIYDQTPAADLVRVAIPDQFATMERWWREPDPKTIAHLKELVRTLEAAGHKEAAKAMREAARESENPDPASSKPFVYPARAKQFEPLWVLPEKNAVELTQDKELSAFADNDKTSEHYLLLTSNDTGPFTSDRSNMRRTQDWLTLEARRPRFMGPPGPEQDDPRFDAVGKANLPPYPWNNDQRAGATRQASQWQLLLQVSMADLAQNTTEGTVYFMINKADLAKQDFSHVVAAYQQT
jgi:Domain of unknown function (DUF1963)